MFNVLSGFFSHDMGIDLGTANTLVYVRGKGILLSEPSVVAIKTDFIRGPRIVAVGAKAQKIIGRTPENVRAVYPLKDGVIADFELTEAMLKHFIVRTCARRFPIKPRILICLPFGSTEVEMSAVWKAAKNVGARSVYLVVEPVAAAIGANLPVRQSAGSMIVDIRGGTTEVAVLSMSDIVHCESIRVAGHKMDDAIIQHVKRKFGLLVGASTAETIKKVIGNACSDTDDAHVDAKGRDIMRGIPKVITLHSQDVTEAISDCVQAIVKTIKEALEQTPPELVSDIVERGIVLCGGGSLLRNLDEVIRRATGVRALVAKSPLHSVVLGTKTILENLKIYEGLLIRHP
jgi:rod shape-determining protein MreB and related proteins